MLTKDEFYRTVLDKISDGVYVCDLDRRIVYWSPGAERITGYTAKEVRGSLCSDGILVHVDENGERLCGIGCPLAASLEGGEVGDVQVYLHHKRGHRVPVIVRAAAIHDSKGKVEGTVEVFTDNSQLLAALRRVDELSTETQTDALTGVDSRRSMEAKLGAAIAERRRHLQAAGVLFADIDHFKNVNDTYGHATGDRVLKMVARTLQQNLRATDTLARWGGEEFLVLLPHMDTGGLEAIAEKLRMLVAESFLILRDGERLGVTISIGGTLLRPKDTRATVVARADRLLYESKTKGRNLTTLAA